MKILSQLFFLSFTCLQLAGQCTGDLLLTTQAEVNAFPSNYGCSIIQGSLILGNLSLSSATNIMDLSPLSAVTTVTGDLILRNPSFDLADLNGLQNLITVGGDLEIIKTDNVSNFDELSNLQLVGGELYLWNNSSLNNMSGLSNLQTIGGLVVTNNDALTDLTGLQNVVGDTPSITINENDALTSLSDFPSIESVGSLTIQNNNVLANLDGLENLQSIDGILYIWGNNSLNSISGLENLNTIAGNFWLSNHPNLTSLSGLENLSQLGGVFIQLNDLLSDLSPLSNLSILDYLSIGFSPNLTSLQGLEGIQSVTEDLAIINNPMLGDLSGLENILNVGGDVVVSQNSVLENISALSNLNSIGEDLDIALNSSLNSLNGLGNLSSIGGDLSISQNPNLSACCELLNLFNITLGDFSIGENAEGCNFIVEIDNQCMSNNLNLPLVQGITFNDPCADNIVLQTASGLTYELIVPSGLEVELWIGNLFDIEFLEENLTTNPCSDILYTLVVESSTYISYNCSLEAEVNYIEEGSSTPSVETIYQFSAEQTTDFYTYELTINGEFQHVDFVNGSFTAFSDLSSCSSTTFALSVLDYLGNVVCSDTQTIPAVNSPGSSECPSPGGSPEYPIVINICPGESTSLSAGLVGAPWQGPDGYCSFCYYNITPNTNTECIGDCFYYEASPEETTMYYFSYSIGSELGGGYILVEVLDCISSDAGITGLSQGNDFLYDGEKDITIEIENFGPDFLDNVQLNWSVNGEIQPSYYLQHVEMAEGESVSYTLGSYFFEYNTDYDIEIWTSNPSGNPDTNPNNDTYSTTIHINDLGADPELMESADAIFVICPGDTIHTYHPNYYNNCGITSPPIFEFQSWTPEASINIGNFNSENFSVFPSTNTYYELEAYYAHTNCGVPPTTLHGSIYVLVEQCGNNSGVNSNSGQLYFDACDNGEQYFFIEIPSGEILDPYYAANIDFTHFDGMSVEFDYILANFNSPCSFSTAVIITGITEVARPLNLSIWLEGVGEASAGLMNSNLSNSQLLPNEQPYNQAPWYYDGTETLPDNTNEIVDWVLVELRSGTPNLSNPNTQAVSQQAALLLSDGTIVGANKEPLGFYGISEGQGYYVSVRHRNHLDVLSSSTVVFNSGATTSYDFTTNANQAFGPEQLKQMPNGKFALYAGDYNGDNVIQSTDYDLWAVEPAAVNVYGFPDGNLDGVIQATDFDVWIPNKAKLGVSELQY